MWALPVISLDILVLWALAAPRPTSRPTATEHRECGQHGDLTRAAAEPTLWRPDFQS